MTRYLVENHGEAPEKVYPAEGRAVTVTRGENIVLDLSDQEAERLNASTGFRITRRPDDEQPEPAPPKRSKPAAPVADEPAAEAADLPRP